MEFALILDYLDAYGADYLACIGDGDLEFGEVFFE